MPFQILTLSPKSIVAGGLVGSHLAAEMAYLVMTPNCLRMEETFLHLKAWIETTRHFACRSEDCQNLPNSKLTTLWEKGSFFNTDQTTELSSKTQICIFEGQKMGSSWPIVLHGNIQVMRSTPHLTLSILSPLFLKL